MINAIKQNVALDVLRTDCVDIGSEEEATVVLSLLSHILDKENSSGHLSLSAPEVNVMTRAAIVRMADFSIDLINPQILEYGKKIISFGEMCTSFPDHHLNCIRHDYIVISTGLPNKRETIHLIGMAAILVEHEVDHLNKSLFFDKAIRMAMVRGDGSISNHDFCPCGSRKKYIECCTINSTLCLK